MGIAARRKMLRLWPTARIAASRDGRIIGLRVGLELFKQCQSHGPLVCIVASAHRRSASHHIGLQRSLGHRGEELQAQRPKTLPAA